MITFYNTYCNKIIKYEQNKYLPTNLVFSKFGYLFPSLLKLQDEFYSN